MVGPAIHYLLPILIAATGGRMVYGDRGAVVGAFATMGVIAGSDLLIAEFNAKLAEGEDPLGQIHMFIGAMIMGPLAAYVMKRLDALWEGKIKAGLRDARQHVLGRHHGLRHVDPRLLRAGPHRQRGHGGLGDMRRDAGRQQPAAAHLGGHRAGQGVVPQQRHQPRCADARSVCQEAAEQGKSVLFLLEANPGPGLGLLLAFSVFGKGIAKATAPGAAIIQFFGGIHEIYFPYVLMKPKLILAMILGGMTGVAINVAFDVGPAGPGCAGLDLRGVRPDGQGQLLRRDARVFGRQPSPSRSRSFLLKTGEGRRRGRPRGRHGAAWRPTRARSPRSPAP